jgi:hypothetical protein
MFCFHDEMLKASSEQRIQTDEMPSVGGVIAPASLPSHCDTCVGPIYCSQAFEMEDLGEGSGEAERSRLAPITEWNAPPLYQHEYDTNILPTCIGIDVYDAFVFTVQILCATQSILFHTFRTINLYLHCQ